jgi:hypothetical protein
MKPDWDKLMTEFESHKTALVADVDCTGAGKSLCEKYEVSGFPTIKYGSPDELEDYHGAREYSALKEFASEKLRLCSPTHLDGCTAEKRKQLEGWLAMSSEQLQDEVKKIKEEAADAGPDGWCNTNWYSDTLKEEGGPLTASAEACAAQCSKESKCKAFSIAVGISCHRYEVKCMDQSVTEDQRYTTYNKQGDDGEGPFIPKGDLSDYLRQRGIKKDEDGEEIKKKTKDPRLGLLEAVQARRLEL